MKTTVKNELTIDSIINLINQQNYPVEIFTSNTNDPNRFTIHHFQRLCRILLDYHFENYEQIEIQNDLNEFSGICLLNEKNTRNKWLQDISLIEFNSMYPNIIVKLWRENKIHFTIYEFGIIYEFILKNYKKIIHNSNINDSSKLAIKTLLNYLYGASASIYPLFIKVSNIHLVSNYAKSNFNLLFEEQKDNVFYIDTDTIYLDLITPYILDKYIKPLGIPYDIEYNFDAMFNDKKRYIIDKNKSVKLHGIPIYRSKFKMEKMRLNKIYKIKKIIKNNEIHENPSLV